MSRLCHMKCSCWVVLVSKIENIEERLVIALETVYHAVSNSGDLFKADIKKKHLKMRAAEVIKKLKVKKLKIHQTEK